MTRRKSRGYWLLAVASFVVASGCSPTHHVGSSKSHATGGVTSSLPNIVSGLRRVSYHGVHLSVPATWPVVDGNHTSSCGGPFPSTPTAFVGPQDNPPTSCAYAPPGPPRDGVGIQPDNPPDNPPPGTTSETPSGVAVLVQRMATERSVVRKGFRSRSASAPIRAWPRPSSTPLATATVPPTHPSARSVSCRPIPM